MEGNRGDERMRKGAYRVRKSGVLAPERDRYNAPSTKAGDGAPVVFSEELDGVPVYRKGEDLKGIASGFLPALVARRLVDDKKARWVNRCSAIQEVGPEPSKRALSCAPGPVVTERAAMGSHYHAVIASSWCGTVQNKQSKPLPLTACREQGGA